MSNISYFYLTLQAPTTQNGQTHSKNLSAVCWRIAWECIWPFCWVRAERVNLHSDFDVMLLLGIIQCALTVICIASAALSIVLRTTNHSRWKKCQLIALFIGVLAGKFTVSHSFFASTRNCIRMKPVNIICLKPTN